MLVDFFGEVLHQGVCVVISLGRDMAFVVPVPEADTKKEERWYLN